MVLVRFHIEVQLVGVDIAAIVVVFEDRVHVLVVHIAVALQARQRLKIVVFAAVARRVLHD